MRRNPLLLFALVAAGPLLGSAGCAAIAPARRDLWPPLPAERFAVAGGYLQVTGVGKADPKLAGATQRRSTSRDAAILDARARLEDYLQRVMVHGTSVGERATVDPQWRRRLEQALSNMEVAGTKWEADDTAAVTVQCGRMAVLEAFGLGEGQ